MKKKLLNLMSVLLVAAGLCVGATSAWAQKTTVGATDNTSGFWSDFSDSYTIQPNRSLRLSFTNHSDKAKTFHTWVGVITSDFDRVTPAAASDTEGYYEYLVLRGDDGRWGASAGAGTFTSNFTRSGDNDAAVEEWQDGAHVELTVSRSGSAVTLRADMYSTAGDYYWEQMVITAGTGTQNIRFFLTTELGHLTDITQNSVDASIYYFYQDYEDATDASSWSAPTLSPTLVTGDATYGNYIQHKRPKSDNKRSAYTYFYNNTDFYEADSYVLEFDMAMGYGNNQAGNVGIFPEGWSIPGNNADYAGNFLFKLVQKEANKSTYTVNGTTTEVTLEWEDWHHFTITVNGSTKTADYDIKKSGTTIANGSGSLNIDETSYKAKGLYFANGRYYGTGKFDNFKIYGTGTEEITTSVSTSAVNLSAGTATVAVATETNAVSSTIKHYYSASPLLTSPVEISAGSVELASGTYYFYSVNTVTGSKSNSVQYAVEASETVSAPTVTCTGNTITLTAQGTSDAGASVTTYYVADAPSANPATDGALLALNTPTAVPQGYYYIYSVSEYGNVSAEPVIVMSIARKQETFDFYAASEGRYESLSDLGDGESGDKKISKLANSAGGVFKFVNGRIECSYANSNGSYWWIRNNGSGNTYNGLFVSANKSDDLYVKVSAKDVVVFTWANGGLTFSGTPNVYGDDIVDGSTVASGTKYMAKANGYIKVHGSAYTTIKSIVVYSDDADMVAAPTLSASGNIVNVVSGGSADDDAVITSYYTTNGDAPTTSSTAVADNRIVLGPGTTTVKVMSYNATTSTASSVASVEVTVPETVAATVGVNGYTTFASPYALDLTDANRPAGLKAYKATLDGVNLSFEALNQTVPAGTGLLLRGENKGETPYNIPVVAEGTAVTTALTGVTAATNLQSDAEGNYIFVMKKASAATDVLTFLPLATSDAVTVPANKAYVSVPATAFADEARALKVLFGDEATGISFVENNKLNGEGSVYNLSGQRVAQLAKGLYIVNGKKVIINK